MSTEISNIKIINGNVVLGKISILPSVPTKEYFPPRFDNPCSCITFCDIFTDYNKLQVECSKAFVNKNNYYFYSSIGTCITKLTSERKNNNFGTIRPKNISWKFLCDIKIKSIGDFNSYFIFNKYPALNDILVEDNQKILIENDFKKFKNLNKNLNDITCFVSESIFDITEKYEIEFPFENFIVIKDHNLIQKVIEILIGKVVLSGNPFRHGFIHSTTIDDKDNNTLHAQYIDKNIEFQALRGGIVEYSTSKEVRDGHFIIFFQNPIKNIFIDDMKIVDYKVDENDKLFNISNILNEYDIIKYDGKNFIANSKNAIRTHYYRFTSIEEILKFDKEDKFSKECFNMIKNIGKSAILNIRSLLYILEDKEQHNFNDTFPPMLGRDVSDSSCIGKMVSTCLNDY